MFKYQCGCINEIHQPSGVLHSVTKCDLHRSKMRAPATLDESYYAQFGLIAGGRMLPSPHVAELVEALGPFPPPGRTANALEIGCGISPYCTAIREAGYTYKGVDASSFACAWMTENLGADVTCKDFGSFVVGPTYSLVVAIHTLEHLPKAPAAITKCSLAMTAGDEFWVVVPDDSDPVNPDHLWHFTEPTLRSVLESAGFVVDRMVVRKPIERERFIYTRARKG